MTTIDRMSTFAGLVVAAALVAASCAKATDSGASSVAEDNGGVTTAGPATTGGAPSAARTVTLAPEAAAPEGASPARDESLAAPPTPAALRAMSAAQGRLDALAAGVAGAKVRFVDCGETTACSARLEAGSLAGLRDLLGATSAAEGGIGYVVREQLDGYAGRTFVADVTLGAGAARAVPADGADLLATP